MKQEKHNVFWNVVEQCQEAIEAKIPILYLLTDEIELIKELIESEELLSNTGSNIFYNSDAIMELPKLMRKSDSGSVRMCVILNYHLYAGDNAILKASILNEYVKSYLSAEEDSIIRNSIVLLVSPNLVVTKGLESYVEVIEVPFPGDEEIEEIIKKFLVGWKQTINTIYIGKIVESLKGLRKHKVNELLRKIRFKLSGRGMNGNEEEQVVFDLIKREKEQMLKKSGVLSVIKESKEEVGGLKELKSWLAMNKVILDNLSEASEEWNIEFPKGILISGIPGSGKSLMAKETAKLFDIPLIKMDMGCLMGAHMGESEANMRSALRMAEAMSPCVLWIDELEKGFAGAKSSKDGDSGTTKRIFASFLTWMQEKKAPCFIFATANNIDALPPEFLRRGRFDQKFYIFMPMKKECTEIFRACLLQKNKSKGLFEEDVLNEVFLNEIVEYCVSGESKKFLIGADIGGIINDAIKEIYLEKRLSTLTRQYLISKEELRKGLHKAIDNTKTYGETNLQDIAECWINLYNNKFIPAAGNDGNRVLFRYEDFAKDNIIGDDYNREKSLSNYDLQLYLTLKEKINLIAIKNLKR